MKRREFLRSGALAAGAPAVLPLAGHGHFFSTPRQRRQEGAPIRLSSNENPLGIPAASEEAMVAGMGMANRYPGPARRALGEAVAAKHGVPREAITLGNGSAEILQMAVQAHVHPRMRLVAASPTYEDVFEYCEPHSWIDIRAIPLLPDMSHDLTAMEEATEEVDSPVLAYVCNPNNPTGSLTPVDDVEAWIRRAPDNVHFLVDEAYVEFAHDPAYRSLDRLALEHPRVVVARTFSKIYGMAGLRLGYAVSHPETARILRSFASGTNTNQMALRAGLAALGDESWVERSLEVNRRGREIVYGVLDELSLEYIPSHTNFVMHRIRGELRAYIRRMADAGFRVGRPFPPMLEFNRLSMGLTEDMGAFAETLRDFHRRGWV